MTLVVELLVGGMAEPARVEGQLGQLCARPGRGHESPLEPSYQLEAASFPRETGLERIHTVRVVRRGRNSVDGRVEEVRQGQASLVRLFPVDDAQPALVDQQVEHGQVIVCRDEGHRGQSGGFAFPTEPGDIARTVLEVRL